MTRKVLLAAATLSVLTIGAVLMLAIGVVTLFRARRLYEIVATELSRVILRIWRVRLDVHGAEPFRETQAVYVSNHSSTLDMFVLVALGLPNARFVGAQDLDGFLRWMAPLGVFTVMLGTLWAPPPSRPITRAAWFRRTERLLRRTGGSIYLSPEGERVTTGRLGPFNADNFRLAMNLGAPIVPIYIHIPRAIDPGKGFDARPGTVRVHVLPTISTGGWTAGNLDANTRTIRDVFVALHEVAHASEDTVMTNDPDIERATVMTFLSSSWYAEDEASAVVAKLLRHPSSPEERAALVAYARQEDEHAALIDDLFRRRGWTRGQPFWIQRIFRLARARATLLLQFYNVELLAGVFYGAMAARTRDSEAKALIKRLLRDEAWHIRLHRELLARELARLSAPGRLAMRFLALLFRVGMRATAHVQARQLAPVLGDAGKALPAKIAAHLRADVPRLFRHSLVPAPVYSLPRASQVSRPATSPAST